MVARATKRVNFRKNVEKSSSYNLLSIFKTIRWIKHVYDIILYINCVFVQIRTGCCGNFFLFLCLHLANIQVSVCRTIGLLVVYLSLCGFCLERFPLPLGALDGLRYFIVALPEPSIYYFGPWR